MVRCFGIGRERFPSTDLLFESRGCNATSADGGRAADSSGRRVDTIESGDEAYMHVSERVGRVGREPERKVGCGLSNEKKPEEEDDDDGALGYGGPDGSVDGSFIGVLAAMEQQEGLASSGGELHDTLTLCASAFISKREYMLQHERELNGELMNIDDAAADTSIGEMERDEFFKNFSNVRNVLVI